MPDFQTQGTCRHLTLQKFSALDFDKSHVFNNWTSRGNSKLRHICSVFNKQHKKVEHVETYVVWKHGHVETIDFSANLIHNHQLFSWGTAFHRWPECSDSSDFYPSKRVDTPLGCYKIPPPLVYVCYFVGVIAIHLAAQIVQVSRAVVLSRPRTFHSNISDIQIQRVVSGENFPQVYDSMMATNLLYKSENFNVHAAFLLIKNEYSPKPPISTNADGKCGLLLYVTPRPFVQVCLHPTSNKQTQNKTHWPFQSISVLLSSKNWW